MFAYSPERRKFLQLARDASVAAVAIVVVGCGQKEKENVTAVTERKPFLQRLSDYVLARLRQLPITDMMVPRMVLSLIIDGRVDEIVLSDGSNAREYLRSMTIDTTTPIMALHKYNRIASIEVALGEGQGYQARNQHLRSLLGSPELLNDNYAMASSLLIEHFLDNAGQGDSQIAESLRVQLAVNKKEGGWSPLQASEDADLRRPVTYVNALCQWGGVPGADGILDLSQTGSGYRSVVDEVDGQPSLFPTLWVGGALHGLDSEGESFVRAHQDSSGGFASTIGGEVIEGDSAEALIYFGLRGNRIFG